MKTIAVPLHFRRVLCGITLLIAEVGGAVVVDPLVISTGQEPETVQLTWPARSGQTYGLQATEDLVNWITLPLLETGGGVEIGYTVQLPANFVKGFWRLIITDRVAIDPYAGDLDEDGIPTEWELNYGLNPLFASDAAGDPDADELTNLAEFRLGMHPRLPAAVRSPAQIGLKLFSP